MQHFEDVTAILVSAAPRQRAMQVLELMVNRTAALGGAVLAIRGDRPYLFVSSRDLPADSVAAACAAWSTGRTALTAGAVLKSATSVVAPLREHGGLVALVYLERPTAFHVAAVRPFEVAFVKAIEADRAPAATDASAVAAAPTHDGERLVMLLDRNEWNVSRVARTLAVTRRTVYLRMQRYGIERRKVPKSNKPIAVPA